MSNNVSSTNSTSLYGEAGTNIPSSSTTSFHAPSSSQDVSSTNSTSLYGEAGTPIPDSSGNVVVRGDLLVLSGNILTTATTGNIFPTNATTINLGLAATTMSIGAGTGTTTINNNLAVGGTGTFAGDITATGADFGNITIGITTDNTISTTSGALVLDSATNTVDINANTYIQAYLNVPDIVATTIQAATGGALTGGLNLYSNDATRAIHLYDGLFQLVAGSYSWVLNADGTTQFPTYKFPYADGTVNQVLRTDGGGTLSWYTPSDANTTYTYTAGSTTGGANLTLTGSDTTTNTVKLSNAGHITATYTSAIEVTLGSDATSGNTASTIVARDASGNFSANSIGATVLIGTTGGAAPTGGLNLYSNDVSNAIHLYDDLFQLVAGSSNWYLRDDGRTSFPNYTFPAADGAVNTVLTTDGAGNVSWALPGGGGSTFGNVTVGVVTDNTISTTTGDLDITATGNNGVNITSGSDAPTLITRNTAVTNISVRGLALSAQTSLTPAVGFGNSLEYQVEAQPGNTERAGYISVNLTDITAGSEDFSMYFGLMQNGAAYTSKMVLDSAGNLVTDGGLTVNNTITTGTGNLALTAAGTAYVTIDSGTTGPTTITRLGGNTNLNTRSLILNSQSTGTPAVGIGNSIEFQVETAVGVTTAGGYLSVTSTDVTPGAEKFKMGFGLMNNGATYTEVAALSSVGDLQIDGDLTVTGNDIKSSSATAITLSGANVTVAGDLTVNDAVVFNGATSGSVTIAAPAVAGTQAYTLPTALPAVSGYVLSGTTGGALSWVDNATGVTSVTGSGHITASPTTGAVTIGSDATTTATASVLVARDANANTFANATFAGFTSVAASASLITLTAASTPNYLVTGSGGQVIQLPNATTLPNGATFTFNNNQSSGAITVNNNSSTLVASIPSGGLVVVSLGDNSIAAGSWDRHDQAPANVSWSTNTLTYPGSYTSSTGNVTANSTTIGSSAGTVSTSSGNLTVNTANGTNSGSMVITAGANGNITLTPNGTGNVATTFNNGGNLTNNRNYVFGAIRNATTQSIGDIWAVNSTGPTNPFRGVSLDNSTDTTKGPGTLMRSYSGGAVAGSGTRGRIIFEKARGTAASPTAIQSGDFLGSVDATGYTSTGWLNDNIAAVTPAFFGYTATENWVSNTALGTAFALSLAPTATTITSAANLIAVLTLTPQAAIHRADTFTFQAGKSGTYNFLDMNGNRVNYNVPIKFAAFLATAVNGTLATTAATGTGSVATLTFGALASAPFTVGSQVIVAGVTPAGYNGTQTVTACTTTTVSFASATTGAQTVAGTVKVAGSVGWQIAISDSPVNGGKMAYWDTTNSRFSYIDTNLAV